MINPILFNTLNELVHSFVCYGAKIEIKHLPANYLNLKSAKKTPFQPKNKLKPQNQPVIKPLFYYIFKTIL